LLHHHTVGSGGGETMIKAKMTCDDENATFEPLNLWTFQPMNGYIMGKRFGFTIHHSLFRGGLSWADAANKSE